MAREQTERVRKLKENFVDIRKKHPEKTIAEIAEEYSLSKRHVYTIIDEISKETGIPKEELLFRPHQKHPSRLPVQRHSKTNPEELQRQITEAIAHVETTIAELDHVINCNKEFMEEQNHEEV